MSIYKYNRVEEQTNAEWWNDYDGKPQKPDVISPALNNVENSVKTDFFRYIGHRTTRTGSVALEFESLDHSTQAVRFYNVSIKSPRGKSYPAKSQGQFIPPANGKFRRFWLDVVNKPPDRWCRIHKSMRSKLSGLVFICKYEVALDCKEVSYFRITEINVNKDHKTRT